MRIVVVTQTGVTDLCYPPPCALVAAEAASGGDGFGRGFLPRP